MDHASETSELICSAGSSLIAEVRASYSTGLPRAKHSVVILSAVFRTAKPDESKRRTYAFRATGTCVCIARQRSQRIERKARVWALLSPGNARVLRWEPFRGAKGSPSSG